MVVDPMSPERPPSPCTKVCTLDADGFCAGCLRTGAEIGRWVSMSAPEQWQLIEELRRRRRQRQTGAQRRESQEAPAARGVETGAQRRESQEAPAARRVETSSPE